MVSMRIWFSPHSRPLESLGITRNGQLWQSAVRASAGGVAFERSKSPSEPDLAGSYPGHQVRFLVFAPARIRAREEEYDAAHDQRATCSETKPGCCALIRLACVELLCFHGVVVT